MYLGPVRYARAQDHFCAERVRERDKAWPFIFRKPRPQRVQLHDTRATFVTVSLANGKSEAWVQDRTGHKSSAVIAKVRRAARMAAEVGMGGFVRMDVAVGLAGDWVEDETVGILH